MTLGRRKKLIKAEPEFINVEGAQESIPRNQFRQLAGRYNNPICRTEPVFVYNYGAQESISPAHVAWRASTTNRVAYRPDRLGLDFWAP